MVSNVKLIFVLLARGNNTFGIFNLEEPSTRRPLINSSNANNLKAVISAFWACGDLPGVKLAVKWMNEWMLTSYWDLRNFLRPIKFSLCAVMLKLWPGRRRLSELANIANEVISRLTRAAFLPPFHFRVPYDNSSAALHVLRCNSLTLFIPESIPESSKTIHTKRRRLN